MPHEPVGQWQVALHRSLPLDSVKYAVSRERYSIYHSPTPRLYRTTGRRPNRETSFGMPIAVLLRELLLLLLYVIVPICCVSLVHIYVLDITQCTWSCWFMSHLLVLSAHAVILHLLCTTSWGGPR